MSEAKFTNGEWAVAEVKVNGQHVENSWHVSVGGFLLADVSSGATFGVVEEIQKANAHLIAAAPEMYEFLDDLSMRDECQVFKKEIMELLAKARGES